MQDLVPVTHYLPTDAVITVLDSRGDGVRIGIDAPRG
ncbi:carbon storage regulator, partial [Bacillus sp. S34]|nr:carbon storage regulator [Bacillus sp. S34]